MKKLSKIILGSILSFAMVVSGGVAALNFKGGVKAAATTVTLENYASKIAKSDGATVTSGSYSYTPKTSARAWNNKTGVKLTGGAGATFSLGTIDISKSNWVGTANTVSANTETDKFASFIEFWALPNVTGDDSTNPELKSMTITLTDVNDSSNKIDILVSSQNNGGTGVLTFQAQATGQNTMASYRSGKTELTTTVGYVSKKDILTATAEATGIKNGGGIGYEASGNHMYPIYLAYDKDDNALYSPITYSTNVADLSMSFAIRDFDEVYPDLASTGDNAWSGFKSDYVNVSIKFNELRSDVTSTSVLINSLGGTTFTDTLAVDDGYAVVTDTLNSGAVVGDTVSLPLIKKQANFFTTLDDENAKYSVVYTDFSGNASDSETLTADSESGKVNYTFSKAGVYTFKFSSSSGYSELTELATQTVTVGSNISNDKLGAVVSKGASATFGSYSYTNLNNATWSSYGVKLTGGKGATFDLGLIDISKSSWAGSETSASTYNSFIEYWYLPTTTKLSKTGTEVRKFTITLTDATDSSNYMQIVSFANDAGGGYGDALGLAAVSSNQTKLGAYRSEKGFINSPSYVTKKYVSSTGKKIETYGVQEEAIALVFDKDKNTLYSQVTYESTSGLGASFAIRNFNETYADGITSGDTAWSGFSGNLVNVSITFDEVSGVDASSILITKLGDYKLNQGLKTIDDTLYNVELGQNIPTYTRTNNAVEIPVVVERQLVDMHGIKNSFVKIFNGNDEITTVKFEEEPSGNSDNVTYTFTADGTYTLKFYKDEETLVGETTIVSRSGYGAVVDVTNATVKLNGGELTDASTIKVGDLITFTPDVQSVTGTVLKDVRSFKLNGTTVDANALPIIYNNETGVWTYTVKESDIVEDVVNIEVVFDRLCTVTFIDEYVTENVVKTAWATDGTVDFPKLSSDNANIRNGNSTDGKLFVGYNRCDENVAAYMKKEGGKAVDSTIYRNPVAGKNTIGKYMEDGGTEFSIYEMLVPDMKFEAVYLAYELQYSITFDNSGNPEWHVEIVFDKEDVDLIKSAITGNNKVRFFYTKSETEVSGAYFLQGTEKAVNPADFTEVNGKYVVELPTVALADGEYEVVGIYWVFAFAQGGTSVRLYNSAQNLNLNVVANKIVEKCGYLKNALSITNGEYGEYIYKVNHTEGEAENKLTQTFYSKYEINTLNKLYSYAGKGDNYFTPFSNN